MVFLSTCNWEAFGLTLVDGTFKYQIIKVSSQPKYIVVLEQKKIKSEFSILTELRILTKIKSVQKNFTFWLQKRKRNPRDQILH